MSRIDTQRNIASVANAQAIGDSPVTKLIRKAVGQIGLARTRKGTIATIAFATLPKPASILLTRFRDVPPEYLFGSAGTAHVVPVDVSKRLATNPTPAGIGLSGGRRGFTTATFTKLGGNIEGELYNVHVTDLLTRLVANPRPLQVARGLFVPNYSTASIRLTN